MCDAVLPAVAAWALREPALTGVRYGAALAVVASRVAPLLALPDDVQGTILSFLDGGGAAGHEDGWSFVERAAAGRSRLQPRRPRARTL